MFSINGQDASGFDSRQGKGLQPCKPSTRALMPTQPAFSPGQSGGGVKLTIYPHRMLRLKMTGAVPPFNRIA
jgi:hypothetical protein